MPGFRNPTAEWSRDWALLAVAVGGVGVFFGVQLTLFNNFVVERLDLEPHELGWVESLREIPGFLNALFVALMIRMSPSLVAVAALGIMGIGLMAYADVGSVPALALYSVVWSVGFHCWLPMEATLALRFSPAGGKGRWLGQLRAVHSIAMLVTIGGCMVLLKVVNYEGMYLLAGGATILGGSALLFASRGHADVEEKASSSRGGTGSTTCCSSWRGAGGRSSPPSPSSPSSRSTARRWRRPWRWCWSTRCWSRSRRLPSAASWTAWASAGCSPSATAC